MSWWTAGRRVMAAAVAAAVVAMAASACSTGPVPAGAEPEGAPSASIPDSGGDPVRLTGVAELPSLATSLVASADGSELLVAERTGVVHRIRREKQDGHVVPVLDEVAVLDLHDQVSLAGEQGFYDMALVDDSSLVVSYTMLDGTLRVVQYPYEPGAALDASSGRVLVELPWRYPFHHGGSLAVSAAGDLLVGLGDQGLSLPVLPAPQDPTLMIGGVLSVPAAVLEDRTLDWTPTPERMVVRGVRNPWRMSVDRANGDLWIGDVGNATMEEVDVVPGDRLDESVPNFGWPYYEGSVQNYPTIPDGLDLTAPVIERPQVDDVCGMVGGYVYRGRQMPWLVGRYVYGDLCSMEIRAFRVDDRGRAVDDRVIAHSDSGIVSLGQDAVGELYTLGVTGGVHRLDPASWDAPDNSQSLRVAAVPSTTEAGPKIDCGVIAAMEPFVHLGSMDPSTLQENIDRINATLAQLVPALPDELQESGTVVQEVFGHLSAELSAAGWDLSSPTLGGLRTDMLQGTGPFAGLSQAMATFFASSCE